MQDAATNGLGDQKPKNLAEISLWQAWAWVAWIERGLQILGIQNLRRKIIRIHHWFTTQTSTLTMFELDGDSRLNNSPLLTLWSLHELNVCNSIAAEQTLPVRFVRPIFHGHSHCAHAFVSFVWYSARFSDTINSGLLPEWKEIGFTLCPVDCKTTAWEYCFAMCCNENKSIYRPGRFIKLRKQWGFVNTKCNVNVQIIFKTQMPLYKLDTSIICCNVIVSTWDVPRKQIGGRSSCATSWEMRGNQWSERIIHHSGSFFVWKWRSKRNQNIIMFPKMCLFKTENSGK